MTNILVATFLIALATLHAEANRLLLYRCRNKSEIGELVEYSYYIDSNKIAPTKPDEVFAKLSRFIEDVSKKLKLSEADIVTSFTLRRVGSSDNWVVVLGVNEFKGTIDYDKYKDRVFLLDGSELKPVVKKLDSKRHTWKKL